MGLDKKHYLQCGLQSSCCSDLRSESTKLSFWYTQANNGPYPTSENITSKLPSVIDARYQVPIFHMHLVVGLGNRSIQSSAGLLTDIHTEKVIDTMHARLLASCDTGDRAHRPIW